MRAVLSSFSELKAEGCWNGHWTMVEGCWNGQCTMVEGWWSGSWTMGNGRRMLEWTMDIGQWLKDVGMVEGWWCRPGPTWIFSTYFLPAISCLLQGILLFIIKKVKKWIIYCLKWWGDKVLRNRFRLVLKHNMSD